jgi:biotin operon repressor
MIRNSTAQAKIVNLLSDSSSHSGDELAEITKSYNTALRELRKKGYEFKVTNNGHKANYELVKSPVLKATHSGKLEIGNELIDCSVLEDGTRLISQRTMYETFGRSAGVHQNGVSESPNFALAKNLQPFVDGAFDGVSKSAIEFIPRHGGRTAYGYEASVVVAVCKVFTRAARSGVTTKHQQKIVERSYELLEAFARIGITALIDEATGYQEFRAENELQQLFALYLRDEYERWVKTFPDELYEEWFRLKGWEHLDPKYQKPACLGRVTNDLVYNRMLPDLSDELKVKRDEHGIPVKLHQYLSTEPGKDHLKDHIKTLTALAKAADTWEQYQEMVDRVVPRKS